jgi:hypothetical protein
VVSFTTRPLYPQAKNPWYALDRRWVGPRAVLDAVVKRKIPDLHGESNPRKGYDILDRLDIRRKYR